MSGHGAAPGEGLVRLIVEPSFPKGPGSGRGSGEDPRGHRDHLKDRVGGVVPPPTHARSIKTQGVRDTLTSPGDSQTSDVVEPQSRPQTPGQVRNDGF